MSWRVEVMDPRNDQLWYATIEPSLKPALVDVLRQATVLAHRARRTGKTAIIYRAFNQATGQIIMVP